MNIRTYFHSYVHIYSKHVYFVSRENLRALSIRHYISTLHYPDTLTKSVLVRHRVCNYVYTVYAHTHTRLLYTHTFISQLYTSEYTNVPTR